MADAKDTDLTTLTGANLADGDWITGVDISNTAEDAAGTGFKMLVSELTIAMQRRGMPRVKQLSSTHSISSTTGTEVTDLQHTLEAGTYFFKYMLIVRSATTTVGPMLGVNFTGTAAVKSMIASWADATSAITAETHTMDDQGVLGFGYISGMANRAYTTTAPNMGTTVGTSATATDIPMTIEGLLIVTSAGDLELWHSSETATATSVEVGSSAIVIRTA